MKVYEKEFTEAHHYVTKATLQWSEWHTIWEKNIKVEAPERTIHVTEKRWRYHSGRCETHRGPCKTKCMPRTLDTLHWNKSWVRWPPGFKLEFTANFD
jgi:hypothetical protein